MVKHYREYISTYILQFCTKERKQLHAFMKSRWQISTCGDVSMTTVVTEIALTTGGTVRVVRELLQTLTFLQNESKIDLKDVTYTYG